MFKFIQKNKKIFDISDNERIKGALFGFFVGDALGVPVEFVERETLKKHKIVDMKEYGTHNQPKGTWSDDSSMVIASIESLINEKKINYTDIMDKFIAWYKNGEYTPFNKVFDIGNATASALQRYINNRNNFKCGGKDIYSNGNGSLMRILPISLYLHYTDDPMFDVINDISSMTHAHIYSVFSCIIYTVFINEFLKNKNLLKAYANMQEITKAILEDKNNSVIGNLEELKKVFKNIVYTDISLYREKDIKSSGYVIDTLEACFWCLLTTDNYSDAVLKAVNLGDDTDTIAALTGGVAGLVYGYDNIPNKWVESLQQKNRLNDITDKFINLLEDKKNEKVLYEWTMGLGDMNKTCNGENPLPNKNIRATKHSWKNTDFKFFDKVECNIKISEEEMNILKMGHIPEVMEDHWFMYCDDDAINYYRSLSGIQIFKGYYKLINGEYIIYTIEINKNKNEYNEENIDRSVNLFKSLIKAECKY